MTPAIARTAFLAFLAFTAAACGSVTSSAPQHACPEIAAWTPAQEAQMGAEYAALPPSSTLRLIVADDLSLRYAARACQAAASAPAKPR